MKHLQIFQSKYLKLIPIILLSITILSLDQCACNIDEPEKKDPHITLKASPNIKGRKIATVLIELDTDSSPTYGDIWLYFNNPTAFVTEHDKALQEKMSLHDLLGKDKTAQIDEKKIQLKLKASDKTRQDNTDTTLKLSVGRQGR